MSDGSVTQKVSTEGADMLTLAGVNDGNLVELSRLCGVRVALRGDAMSITGPSELVSRAVELGRRMVDRARQRTELTPDDVLRLSEDDGGDSNGNGVSTAGLRFRACASSSRPRPPARPSICRRSASMTSW